MSYNESDYERDGNIIENNGDGSCYADESIRQADIDRAEQAREHYERWGEVPNHLQ